MAVRFTFVVAVLILLSAAIVFGVNKNQPNPVSRPIPAMEEQLPLPEVFKYDYIFIAIYQIVLFTIVFVVGAAFGRHLLIRRLVKAAESFYTDHAFTRKGRWYYVLSQSKYLQLHQLKLKQE